MGAVPGRPQLLQAVKARLLSFLYRLPCAAMDLSERLGFFHSCLFFLSKSHPKGKERKERRRVIDFFLSKALRCSEVRIKRKERTFFLSSRDCTTQQRGRANNPQKSMLPLPRISTGKSLGDSDEAPIDLKQQGYQHHGQLTRAGATASKKQRTSFGENAAAAVACNWRVSRRGNATPALRRGSFRALDRHPR